MPTEDANFIDGLNSTRPDEEEPVGEGNDHLQLIKKTLKQTFVGTLNIDDDLSDVYNKPLLVGPIFLNDLPTRLDALEGNYMKLDEAQDVLVQHLFTAGMRLTNTAGLRVESTTEESLNGVRCAATNEIIVGDAKVPTVIATENHVLRLEDEGPGQTRQTVLTIEDYFHPFFQAFLSLQMYPVGSVIFSVNNVNPAARLGGTWEAIGQGRYIAGVGLGEDLNGKQRTIGERDLTEQGVYEHQLTEAEMASHSHTTGFEAKNSAGAKDGAPDPIDSQADTGNAAGKVFQISNEKGGDQGHNTMPPEFGLYLWERTAI